MKWIKNNKLEFTAIILIAILTLFLRFYKLDEYMTFLGDEGRDALVIKDILVNFDIPLLGPSTSVGNMYLGPLYYYMMAVPMAIFWLDPVAAAGMVALIGTLTVGLIYYLSREWFGKKAAVIAAVLYSVSPVTIIYSKSSWNPNPAPFFALLSFLGLYKAHKTGDFAWFVLTGVSLAFAIQMHYLALILIPIFGLLWLNELRIYLKKKGSRQFFVGGTVGAICFFLILMSPLVLFDLRHNLMNYRAITTFFASPDKTVGFSLLNNLQSTIEIYQLKLIGRYMAGEIQILAFALAIIILLPLGWVLYSGVKLKHNIKWQYLALYSWILIGCFGLSFYHHEIYDHYLGFINPAPFLLLGASFFVLELNKNKTVRNLLQGLFLLMVVGLILVNLSNSPLLKSPNKQLKRTQEVAKFIIQESQNKPFNFALIAGHNYDAAYQFYLGEYGHKPGQLPFDQTEQLFVVCEDSECKPVGHAKYEIAAFGWTTSEWEKDVQGVKIYKLIPNPDQPR